MADETVKKEDAECTCDTEEKAAETETAGQECAEGVEAEPAAEKEAEEAEPEKEPTLEEMKAQIELARAGLLDVRMRAQAETENFKKRLEREHAEHLKFAAEKVMKDLIPTLDNLELAITYGTKDEACEKMMQGIVMTQKLLLEAVGRHGLEVIGKKGEPFDPARHEAVCVASLKDMEPDTVAQVMQSGYSLAGRVLRPAKVMVNKV